MKAPITLALLALALTLSPTRASASTAADCQLLVVALSEQVAATTFLNGDTGVKVELQLQHHLSQASKNIDQFDIRDAIKQMKDFESDTTNAAASSVLTAADGDALNASADGVIACVQQMVP